MKQIMQKLKKKLIPVKIKRFIENKSSCKNEMMYRYGEKNNH